MDPSRYSIHLRYLVDLAQACIPWKEVALQVRAVKEIASIKDLAWSYVAIREHAHRPVIFATSSAAHSRASCIFPASRKAKAFANAWLRTDRSAGDSFSDRAPRTARPAEDMLGIGHGPMVQLGFDARHLKRRIPIIAPYRAQHQHLFPPECNTELSVGV